MAIRGVLFDLDGVLLDAREWHYQALNEALAAIAGPDYVISPDDHDHYYNGRPTSVKLQMLARRKGLPTDHIPAILADKQERTIGMIRQYARPDDEHIRLFARLAELQIFTGVCSNAVTQTLLVALERLDLLQFVDYWCSNETVSSPKPSSDIYLQAMSRLYLEPWETLIVEDSPVGLESAHGSGAHVLKVLCPKDLTYHGVSAAMRFYGGNSLE